MLSLLQAAGAGPDEQAFLLQLFRSHQRLMYGIVRQCVRDPDVREDLMQETMVRLTEKRDLLRTLDPPRLSAYVAAAARNTAYSYLRRRSVEDRVLCPWSPDLAELPAHEPDVDERLILKEEKQRFVQVWKDLPDEDRVLLESKYILRQSDQALAKTLGCKPDSVRMKLTRLRRKVLKLVQDLEEGEDGT